MKKSIIIFCALICYSSKSQSILLLDKINSLPVSEVNISCKEKGTISDSRGLADISIFKNNDELIIQHIGFISKKFIKNKTPDTIYLEQNKYMLKTINFEEIKKPLTSSPVLKNTIDRKAIEKLKVKSTADLLQQSLGINVQESQSGGGSPNFRGMEANRLLLVVDGIPLNNAIYRSGHVQSSNVVNSFFIDKINIVTGPSATVYGDGAMGGAIVINTINENSFSKFNNIIEQKHESSSSASSLKYINLVEKGRFIIINGFGIEKNGNLRMGKNRFHGYKDWGNEPIITDGNEQLKTAYSKYDVIQKVYLKNYKKISLSLNTQFSGTSKISRFDRLNDIQDGERKYQSWYYGPQEKFSQSLKINKKANFIILDELSIIGSWQTVNESRHKQKANDELKSNRYEEVLIFDAIADVKKEFKKTKLNYGLSIRKQHVKSTATLSNSLGEDFFNTTRYPDGGSEIFDASIYAQAKFNLYKGGTLFLGERYNISSLKAMFNNNTIIDLPFNEIETENKALVSSLQILQKISNKISASLSYFIGFRNPNIDDVGKIFSKNDMSVVIPNNNLKPEKTNNQEYTLIYSNQKIRIEGQYFITNLQDAIQRTNSNINGEDSIMYDGEIMRVQMNQNIESAKITGLSVGASFNDIRGFNIDFWLNYLKGKNNNNQPLAHIPPTNLKISLSKKVKASDISLIYNYCDWKNESEYDYNGVDNLNEATIDGNPPWQIFNLIYDKTITENIICSFSINNLLDAHYKTFGSGISSSGRNFVVSLTSKF